MATLVWAAAGLAKAVAAARAVRIEIIFGSISEKSA